MKTCTPSVPLLLGHYIEAFVPEASVFVALLDVSLIKQISLKVDESNHTRLTKFLSS